MGTKQVISALTAMVATLALLSACRGESPERLLDMTRNAESFVDLVQNPAGELPVEDIIPDFSTVGYRHGDEDFPDYGNIINLPSPEAIDGDATGIIQNAIDNAPAGSVIKLQDGTYNVEGVLLLDKDKVILRGNGKGNSVIKLTGPLMRPGIVVGTTVGFTGSETAERRNFSGRLFRLDTLKVNKADDDAANVTFNRWLPETSAFQYFPATPIAEDYCPVGRYSVEVISSAAFSVGCNVVVERPHNAAWIHDIGMDAIAGANRQWSEMDMTMRWERTITAVEGNVISFDAPLVQSLDAAYGGGRVGLYSLERRSGCGIEDLCIDSDYDASIVNGNGIAVDENHAWYGIVFTAAEDCWVRDVAVRHVGYAAVQVSEGTRCVTVKSCSFEDPVSYPDVARRYGFVIEGAELCLFTGCSCEKAAMGFSTTSKGGGPNVYHRCIGTDMRTGSGPHLYWSTGTLFDCCSNSAGFRVTDHGKSGSGHGWTGANTVFWNLKAGGGEIECESPWAAENVDVSRIGYEFHSAHPSGRNYCVGLEGGRRVYLNYSADDQYVAWGLTRRPDASWYPSSVAYGSGGSGHVNLPCEAAQNTCSWWPRFTSTSFTDPESLYQCQLEDRHSSL